MKISNEQIMKISNEQIVKMKHRGVSLVAMTQVIGVSMDPQVFVFWFVEHPLLGLYH